MKVDPRKIYDFEPAVRGDTYSNDCIFTFNPLFDFTGASITMRIARSFDSPQTSLILSNANGKIIILSPTSFSTNFGIVDMESGAYLYDIQIMFATGINKTYIRGAFSVLKDVPKISNQ